MRRLPFGSWPSPLTPEAIAAGVLRFRELTWEGESLYWVEGRPVEGGRGAICCHRPHSAVEEVSGTGVNCRTRVHEYGGGSLAVVHGTLYYSQDPDQCLHRAEQGYAGEPLTGPGMWLADGTADHRHRRLIYVGELGEENLLVAVAWADGDLEELDRGRDFYAFPRVSPDGAHLAWMAWDHPNLPWNDSELWLADLSDRGLQNARRIAGGAGESVFQPEWSPDGSLHYVSDRSGWWNLYRWDGQGGEALAPLEAEFGLPLWNLGESTYCFLEDGRLFTTYQRFGRGFLAVLDRGNWRDIDTPYCDFRFLKASGGEFAFVGGRPDGPTAVVRFDGRSFEVVRESHSLTPNAVSIAEPFSFKGWGGETSHAFFYPPASTEAEGPKGEKPPALMILHGGPTGATTTALELSVQFWTSRGFAVIDVNYAGSTGYGRAYRERLRGVWGDADVFDAAAAAAHLVAAGSVSRIAVRGGSAGGYTVLRALMETSAFTAGACYYGVSDAEALMRETHKFESRYGDFLFGAGASSEELRKKSPLHHAQRLKSPVIFFQGLDDKVVPPNQTRALFEALQSTGTLTACLEFAGEGHGFRSREAVRRSLECELAFYGRVFGFPAPAPVPPLVFFPS